MRTLLVWGAKTGIGWRDLPLEMGASQCTVRRRQKERSERGLFTAIVDRLLTRLKLIEVLINGGNAARARCCGSKLTVMSDRHGPPLMVVISAANEHDVRFLLPAVFCEFSPLRDTPGRQREKSALVRADTGHTSKDLLSGLI